MSKETWVAAEIVKLLWRVAHSAISDFWERLELAAIQATEHGGTVAYGPVKFRKAGSFLWMKLPSGRALCYPYPMVMSPDEIAHRYKVRSQVLGKKVPNPHMGYRSALTYKTAPDVNKRPKVIPEPDGSVNMRWARIATYGGMLTENVTQAVARDVLAESMFRHEAAGYPIVLTVHDEEVAEADEGFGSVQQFEEIMSEVPVWASGLPIAASGWSGVRYRKG